MKYLKTYEKLVNEEDLIDQIKVALDEITNNYEEDVDLEDCPFLTELNILHQKYYIDDLFFDITWDDKKMTLGDFKKVYNKLVVEAEKEILKQLKKDPNLYNQYYVENYVDAPEYIKNAHKYNL